MKCGLKDERFPPPPPFCLALFLRSHLAVFIKKNKKKKNNEKKDLNVSGLL